MSTGRTSLFSTPAWLRDLGFASWLLVARYMIQTTVLCLARVGRFSPGRRPLPFEV